MLNVAIVAGGDSGEHGISMKSGRQVLLHIDPEKFRPYLIEIQGKNWNYLNGRKKIPVNKNDFTITVGRKKIHFQVIFNAIHGTPGEDGKLLGYFDMLRIPYTSCDVATSALAFNKSFCKNVVGSYGIPMAKSVHLLKNGDTSIKRITQELTLPCFVKPNNGGSSVGMSKVKLKGELKSALAKAFKEDAEVIVEEFIAGRELTCGVLRTEGKIISLPVTEIISHKEFFDFEAKYRKGLAEEVVPAAIPAADAVKCGEISKLLYEKLNCRGVVRFDYIFNGIDFCFLEVNTVPGMTRASIVPRMVYAHGWSFRELVTRLISEVM
ncbi:MAG: D-alanine--D-alanine ligase [Bacteroidota bacterium]